MVKIEEGKNGQGGKGRKMAVRDKRPRPGTVALR